MLALGLSLGQHALERVTSVMITREGNFSSLLATYVAGHTSINAVDDLSDVLEEEFGEIITIGHHKISAGPSLQM